MIAFWFTLPSDNLAKNAAIAVNTGAEDPAYVATNLIDDRADVPAKLSNTSGSWVIDLGAAKRVDFVPLINHNFDAALNVRLQGNAANAWGAPTLDQPFTIPANYADSFKANVWLNLATLLPVAGDRTFRYWRLVVVGVNSANVAIGEWPLYGVVRNFGVANIQRGSTRRIRRPAILQRTPGGIRHVYDIGVTTRSVSVEVLNDLTTMRLIDQWFRDAAGIAKPFTIVPNYTEDDAWFVAFTTQEQAYTRIVSPEHNSATLEFEELSRGLYL